MEHIFIQVIDPSPESAEEIKSLLRNSGINVHVLNAASAKQAEQQIKEFRPSLIIYQSASGPEIPVELIGEMARLNGVFLAVRFAPENTEVFTRALAETACIGLDESESDRVIDLVGLLAGMGHAARELHAASAHHDELQKRYELLLETTNEAVAYLHEGLHVFANTAYLKALQVKEFSELESLSMLDVVRSGDLDLKTLIRDFNQGIFPAEPLSATVRGPAGNEFEALLTFAPVRFGGEHCVQKVIRQQGAGGNLHQELDRIRSLDQLTGTHHRQYFMQELECALDNMDDRDSGAVFYLEPDGIRAHLKTWTTADHDDYVVRLAQEVRDHLDGDLVARFGDTSFSFLALRDHKGELGQLGEAIRAGVELMPPGKHGNEQPKSCSIGMVMLGPQIGSAEEALVQARSAFLKAAKSGNTLCRYRPSRRANGDEDEGTQWVERLKYALNNDDFYSVQNAVINLEGESEGLFENQTFLHEEDRDVGLEEFAAAADRANLASAIDRQVIPGLLRAISGSGDRHIINVSGNSVQDFSFASWFQAPTAGIRCPGVSADPPGDGRGRQLESAGHPAHVR